MDRIQIDLSVEEAVVVNTALYAMFALGAMDRGDSTIEQLNQYAKALSRIQEQVSDAVEDEDKLDESCVALANWLHAVVDAIGKSFGFATERVGNGLGIWIMSDRHEDDWTSGNKPKPKPPMNNNGKLDPNEHWDWG